jgi:hypothetical protein
MDWKWLFIFSSKGDSIGKRQHQFLNTIEPSTETSKQCQEAMRSSQKIQFCGSKKNVITFEKSVGIISFLSIFSNFVLEIHCVFLLFNAYRSMGLIPTLNDAPSRA